MDIKKLEAIVKIEPNNPKHWFNLAIAYLQENRFAEANKAIEESIKVNHYFAPSQFIQGLLLLYGRDFRNGIKFLEKATTIDEDVYNKIISDQTLREIVSNLIKASIKVIQDQLEFQPNNIENLSIMGKILLYTNSFEASINYHRKIIELKPDNWESYLYLGLAYEGLENYEQAIFYLKRATVSNQYLSEAYWIMGRIYIKLGNYGLALKNYEKAVEISPNNTRYLNSLAKLYYILEKNTQAIRTLQLAIDINPNSKWSYFYLGQCLEKEYNFDLAIEQYEKSINIDPQFTEAKLALAKLYQMNGNSKRAIEILEELAIDNNDTEVYLNLAQMYYSTANYIKAKEITQKIIDLNPNNQDALYLLVLCLLNLRKNKEIEIDENYLIQNLENFYSLKPNDRVISLELFKLYVDNKNYEKAKEIFEKSKINVTDQTIAQKISLIYLQEEDYDNFLSIFKNYELYNFEEFLFDVIHILKEKNSSFISVFINEFSDKLKELKSDSYIKLMLILFEYIYLSNTLQALEFFKQKIKDVMDKKDVSTLLESFIYFTLYSEYKDRKYLDSFISNLDSMENVEIVFRNFPSLNLSPIVINSVKLAMSFYIIIIKSNHDFISHVFDFLYSTKEFDKNVLITSFSELIPIFIDNGYYVQVLELLNNFNLLEISYFKKLFIEALFLAGKNSDVVIEAQEYMKKFSYDSYINLLYIIAIYNQQGEISDDLIKNLQEVVLESDPLAFAIYSLVLLSKDNVSEATRYALRAMEFLYTLKHNYKHTYQIVIIINILSIFFEKVYKINDFIKGLKQLISKYSENYNFYYLLAKYLFLTEDYIDSELIIKKALKLAKNSSQLLESQSLLGKIREEKERYQKLIEELEILYPGITEKLVYINTLYKRDNIEELYKIVEQLSTSIEDVIIKFYIFDKLEVREQVVYYLNILKIFALENSRENLLELIENKLLLYSNMEEFEEIKQKAEVDYLKIFKKKSSVINEQKQLHEKEYKIEQKETEKVEISESKIDTNQTEIAEKKQISKLQNYDDLQNVVIKNFDDFIISIFLKIYFMIFLNDSQKYQQIQQIIDNSNFDLQSLNQNQKIIVDILTEIIDNINNTKEVVFKLKEFTKNYSKDKEFSFFVNFLVAILNYKLNKIEEALKYFKYCQENIDNYAYLANIINSMQNIVINKISFITEKSTKIPISSIKNLKDIQELNNAEIRNIDDFILLYYLKMFFLVFYPESSQEYLVVINKIFEEHQNKKDEIIKNSDTKKLTLLNFIQSIDNHLAKNDIKNMLISVKGFLVENSNDVFYSFFSSILMIFLSYKLNRGQDFRKYLDFVKKTLSNYPEIYNFINMLEKEGVRYENISN